MYILLEDQSSVSCIRNFAKGEAHLLFNFNEIKRTPTLEFKNIMLIFKMAGGHILKKATTDLLIRMLKIIQSIYRRVVIKLLWVSAEK